MYIFCQRALASYRCRPLSSNVRPRRTPPMLNKCLVIPALALGFQAPAIADDLQNLDRVGRRIAERPCAKPKTTTKIEKNVHDESITDRFISLRCPNAGSEIVRSSLSRYHYCPVKRALPHRFASIGEA